MLFGFQISFYIFGVISDAGCAGWTSSLAAMRNWRSSMLAAKQMSMTAQDKQVAIMSRADPYQLGAKSFSTLLPLFPICASCA